jgi:hypothetical protein
MRTSVKANVRVLCTMLVALFVWGGSAQAQPFAGGAGVTGSPYQIATAGQLLAIGSDPNLWDKCFVLVADIDLDPNLPGGRVFDAALIAPDILDANGLDTPGVPFTGSFDGRDHVIRHLVISAPTQSAVGLFGRIGIRNVGKWGTPGVVLNVRLEGVTIAGHESVGALAGVNGGTILNCAAHGRITGERDCIGGLVGYNTGTITMSRTEGNVSSHNDYVGGLVGFNPTGVITECSSACTVRGSEEIGGLAGSSSGHIAACTATGTVHAGRWAGGLVALNTGSVVLCRSTSEIHSGDVTGGLMASNSGPIRGCSAGGNVEGAETTGGLIGNNSGAVAECSASGNVSGGGEEMGGFVGSNSGAIANSYATGRVDAGAHGEDVGGFAGENGGVIVQCYARGDVMSEEESGGLVGSNSGSITACYAVGRVQVTRDEDVGGLVGRAWNGAATDHSFWDVDTTGLSQSNGGVGLHTAAMQTAQTYLDAGWDFVNTWMICEGVDYPRLQWEQYDCDDDG